MRQTYGLTDQELDAIRERLGRDPNELELAMFGRMWSEDCSYKSSKPLLATLATGGGEMVAGPGGDARVVSIGGGLAVAFRLAPHNRPSAVDPGQEAAPRIRGLVRNIVTLGARPIGVLAALKFGDPAGSRTCHLVRNVVRAVGGYGTRAGVPTIGVELVFHPSYGPNPLVNVMAVGLLDERLIVRAQAPGPGNVAVLFGSTTGRDGIDGTSERAGATLTASDLSKRPDGAAGDAFAEKRLIETTLALIARGLVEGLEDVGPAGITGAASETADRAGTGMLIDLDAIPRREEGMAPFEVMTSESQERMLAIVRPDRLGELVEVCAHGACRATVIGRMTADRAITVVAGGVEDGPDGATPAEGSTVLARIPAAALWSDAIVHERRAQPPAHRRQAPAPGAPVFASDRLPIRGMDPGAVLRGLLGNANLGSRAWVTTQLDATIGTDIVEAGERAAGILRVQGTRKGLVCATDAVAGVGAHDPYLGAALAVAECTRNVAVTGARPLGVTHCLNYGNPEDPVAFWQFTEGVRGLGDACRALDVPVTGGSVSLYNESPEGRIIPTAQIGVVGLLDDVSRRVGPAFRRTGDVVVLLGEAVPGLAGSAYASLAGAAVEERLPSLDLARETSLQAVVLEAAAQALLASAQDVSAGGLAVALAECSIWGGVGASLRLEVGAEPAVELFGESPSRVVATVRAGDLLRLESIARGAGVPLQPLGEVGGDRLTIEVVGGGAAGAAEERGASVADPLDCTLDSLRRAWEQALPRALGEDSSVPPGDPSRAPATGATDPR